MVIVILVNVMLMLCTMSGWLVYDDTWILASLPGSYPLNANFEVVQAWRAWYFDLKIIIECGETQGSEHEKQHR